MTNKRLKPRTLGTLGTSKDTVQNSRGLQNPAAAGAIGARKFGAGGNKALQYGQNKDNKLLIDDDQTSDMVSVGGGSGYDDAMSDIGGIRRVDTNSEYPDD